MTAGEQNWSKKTFCKGELHLLQVKHAAVRAALPQQWETQPGTRTATLFRASFPTPAAALAQHCGSLKALSLWNVPDFQRKKELLRGRQTGKMVCKPTQARPASSLLYYVPCIDHFLFLFVCKNSGVLSQLFCLKCCSMSAQTSQHVSSPCMLQ